jgi:FtsP/CotA-like multicopper oxidase with cupredoxin domain
VNANPVLSLVVLVSATFRSMASAVDDLVRLTVGEEKVTIKGKEVSVMAIRQSDGQSGYSPQKDEGFHVEVVNNLTVPTTIHWHGLVLPNLMDGVPFVTQEPIPPGGSFVYNFPLKQEGSYWMHSHYGLQEQLLNSAPLVIWTPEEKARADQQHVVMLSDFSFTSPVEILKKLKEEMPMSMPKDKDATMGAEAPKRETLSVQVWDEAGQRFGRDEVEAEPPDIDVKYDALLANRRTIEDPEIVSVPPGQTLLLRIIGASSATDFYINTGALEAELLAVDGQPIEPLKGNFFQLAIAQRIDLRVTMPAAGGTFPILFQGEGTKLLAATVLVSGEAAEMPVLAQKAVLPTGTLDNVQEKRLRAARPLPEKKVDRSHPGVLGGRMQGYTWTINGAAYPNREALDVKEGERVEIVLRNITKMGHPMHLHGHDFQVVEIDGEKISGAVRDTVEVPPGSTIKIVFDADNPGVWAFHCHIIYHLATGMFTVVKYEGADTQFWQPEESQIELKDSIPAVSPSVGDY